MSFKITENLEEDLRILSQYKIFFGHQSVGSNIIDGLMDLIKDSNLNSPNVVEYSKNITMPDTYFLHTHVGENSNPISKCVAFSNFLKLEMLNDLDLVMLKFCYVDITQRTDIQSIFNYYKSMIDSIMVKNPKLRIVHITVPLKSNSGGFKLKIKRILGREDYTDADNIKRCEFNDMLKREYNNESIFDLAKSESTYSDGSRESFTANSKKYYSLIRAYTYDGGHLNELGRKIVAAKMVHYLVSVLKKNVK